MLHRFIAEVNAHYPLINTSTSGLLAVSGGVDSMVLSLLMQQAGYPFAIAHCNFHLRPGDCDRDEQFVRQWADQMGVPCHVAQFDTLAYASEQHISVEEAARNLRYAFFEEVRVQHHYAYIATAHHANDAEETFFINLLRGTGLAGLRGIPPVNGSVVRPLLSFTREEIASYADQQGLQHVEDVTNAGLTYMRNRVRHQLLPLLRTLSPAFDPVMASNMQHLSDAWQMLTSIVGETRQRLFHDEDGRITIPVAELLPLQPRATWFFELLRPYGFTAAVVQSLADSLQGQPGRWFFSSTYQLLVDRDSLILVPIAQEGKEDLPPEILIQEVEPADLPQAISALKRPNPSSLPRSSVTHLPSPLILVDADTLTMPLHLRHWQEGDRFYPFGMSHTQLLSDYFSDHKFSRLEKSRAWLLVDAEERIVWVVGHRADNRFRVTPATTKALKITLYVSQPRTINLKF